MTVARLKVEMSVSELMDWYIYDEMTAIMAEIRALERGMPEDWVISMTIEQQEKHDWIGRIDPKTLKRKPIQ